MNKHEEILRVAYELYERSGMMPGRELENWLKAEKIVMMRHAEKEKSEAAAPAATPKVRKAAATTRSAKPDPKKTVAGKPAAKKTATPRKAKT